MGTDDQTIQRLHRRVDDHETRLVRVETRIVDAERRLEVVEGMPRDLNHVRSAVDRLQGQMTIMLWLLLAIAGGVLTAGFALFRGGV